MPSQKIVSWTLPCYIQSDSSGIHLDDENHIRLYLRVPEKESLHLWMVWKLHPSILPLIIIIIISSSSSSISIISGNRVVVVVVVMVVVVVVVV